MKPEVFSASNTATTSGKRKVADENMEQYNEDDLSYSIKCQLKTAFRQPFLQRGGGGAVGMTPKGFLSITLLRISPNQPNSF